MTHYVIFVHGTGSEHTIPDASMGGYATVDIEIGKNPLVDELNDDVISSPEIPSWIKNNADWWVKDTVPDDEFASGIEFLIKEGIIKVPLTQNSPQLENDVKIPSWIKNNADWWSKDLISDEEFAKGLEFLVSHGIIDVQT
jgi:hypothetical protein